MKEGLRRSSLWLRIALRMSTRLIPPFIKAPTSKKFKYGDPVLVARGAALSSVVKCPPFLSDLWALRCR